MGQAVPDAQNRNFNLGHAENFRVRLRSIQAPLAPAKREQDSIEALEGWTPNHARDWRKHLILQGNT
jgi:hypothetical protein